MSEITVQGLLTDAGIIRGEIHDSQNSHDRVGKMFEDIIKYIQAHESSWATGGGGGGGDTSSITGTLLLNGLNGKDNPSLDDQILHWSSNTGWGYIPTPTGGPGTGGGVTWQQLRANTSEQINASHLSDALSNYVAKANMAGDNAVYEWWGNKFSATPSNGVYKINGAIEFSNGVRIAPEEGNHTLKIEAWDNSSNPAHIYATGGVSALGNSSSGGGGEGEGEGEGTPLNNLLGYINSHDYYGTTDTVSPSTGDTIIYNGTKWKVGSIDLEDLLGTAPAQFVADKILAKDSGDNYKWIDASGIGGSTSITNLWKVGDVGTSTGYSSNIANKHILRYNDGVWGNVIFDVSSSLPQGTSSTLACINLAGTNYVLPQANGNVMGIVKAGTGLSASSGTLNHSNAVTAVTSVGLYKLKYDAQGHITGTTSVVKADITALGIPGQDTNTTYSAGNGLNPLDGGTVFSVKAASGGGLTVGSDGVKIDPNTNKRVLWGNDDKLTNDIGSDITFDYGRGIQAYTTSNNTNAVTLLRLSHNSDNTHELDLGYGSTVSYGVTTQIYGVDVDFFTADVDSNGNVVKNAQNNTVVSHTASFLRGGGLAIGNGVLKWDSVNNALYVQKIDGTAANFYATGGVSALGMSSGSGSVPAMTFGNVTVNNTLTSTKLVLNNSSNAVLLNILSGKIQVSSNGGMVEALIKGGSTITLGDATNNECEIYMYDSNGDKYSFDIDAAINAGILVEA